MQEKTQIQEIISLNGAQAKRLSTDAPSKLRCPACRNEDLFAQVMEYQVNLVDGNFHHLHMLVAGVDFYRCYICGEYLEFGIAEEDLKAYREWVRDQVG